MVVAVDQEAAHVVDQPAAAERMGGRRVGEVVADHLHADPQLPQRRVVEIERRRCPLPRKHRDVARAVVGAGGQGQLVRGRDARHHVAPPGVQGVADEAAALRPPCVLHRRAELGRDQPHDPVLEALLAAVRERQVVGIGADPQHPRLRPGRKAHA
jgi:hypothetical protein